MSKGDIIYRKDHFCSWEEKSKMSEKQEMSHPPSKKINSIDSVLEIRNQLWV